MDEKQRVEIIPELTSLLTQARELQKEIDYFLSRHQLHGDKRFTPALDSAYRLTGVLRTIGDDLKRAGADSIQDYVTSWYRFRLDEDDAAIPDPVYESITYDDEDTWTLIMTTTTHGKERVVVHSNAATWEEVYSADRIE